MDKNTKLDKLLQAARESKPVISFEEASGFVKGAATTTGIFSSTIAKGAIAIASVAVLTVAGIYFYPDKPQANQAPAPVETSTQAVAPVAQQPEIKAETPAADAIVAVPKAEKEKTAEQTEVANEAENVGVKYTEVKANTLRTVTITNDKGSFAVKFAGDDLKELMLNNTAVNQANWNDYPDVIQQALDVVNNSKKGESQSDAGDKNFMNDFKEQLIKDGLINGNITSLKFNKDGLMINGVAQDNSVHQRYLQFYKSKTGKDIGSTNFSIKGNQN